jgi:diaminopimelate decarboxylase
MMAPLTNEILQQLAREFGTPLYVYHAEKISDQYQQLRNAFQQGPVRLFYAAKALTNQQVLRHIRDLGCDVDCSSINEVHLALRAGFSPDRILYTSNSIDFSELEAAQQAGVHLNIDSLSNLEKFGRKFSSSYPVGIRLRPNILAGGNLKISTGHSSSKFGVPLEQLDAVQDIVRQTGLVIHALHIHTGSEIKEVAVFFQGVELLLGLLPQFPAVQVIDLGGGFKVPYAPGETGTDIAGLGQQLAARLHEYQQKASRQLQVWFEPGKYLVSEAGHFITRVTVLKATPETLFAGVDTGLNHLIRPMFYGAYHHIDNLSHSAGTVKKYTIVGNICETDTFAEAREIPEIREGDLLVFRNAGAYGFEMASNYNSRFRPAEVMVQNGKATLIRRRETLDDLLRTQLG